MKDGINNLIVLQCVEFYSLVLLAMTSCTLVGGCHCLEGTYCFDVLTWIWRHIFWNIFTHLSDYMVSHNPEDCSMNLHHFENWNLCRFVSVNKPWWCNFGTLFPCRCSDKYGEEFVMDFEYMLKFMTTNCANDSFKMQIDSSLLIWLGNLIILCDLRREDVEVTSQFLNLLSFILFTVHRIAVLWWRMRYCHQN
jgi:hypothetical protein